MADIKASAGLINFAKVEEGVTQTSPVGTDTSDTSEIKVGGIKMGKTNWNIIYWTLLLGPFSFAFHWVTDLWRQHLTHINRRNLYYAFAVHVTFWAVVSELFFLGFWNIIYGGTGITLITAAYSKYLLMKYIASVACKCQQH